MVAAPARSDSVARSHITYDRDTVVQCALPLMARMEPLSI
jgi:hypothetical protein